jgi:hypothetical protein
MGQRPLHMERSIEITAKGSITLGKDAEFIADNCPRTKKPTMIPGPYKEKGIIEFTRPENRLRLLKSALLQMSTTLEQLHLVVPCIRCSRHYNKNWWWTLEQYPTLRSLRSLEQVKQLQVEFGALCPVGPSAESYCLASDLPPSIEVLELVATWEKSCWHTRYVRRGLRILEIIAILDPFCEKSAKLQPSLRRVRLLMPRVSKAFRHRTAPLRDSLATRGIKFEVDSL